MGGKWIIRLRKGLASRCWENLILAMLGEQFMVGEEICGAVVSVRFQVNPTTDMHTPVARSHQLRDLFTLTVVSSLNALFLTGGHYLHLE